ncbi:MAG: tRNA1(Val) (adenine(37)-N6)-methyltransferase [Bacteroidota bacterium]|nr:methyltransferase [Kiloniellaceae bacterium]
MSAVPETTEDAFLGGRLRLRQPAAGYRAAIDPVLLAAAVPAAAGERVADLGCGVGTAGLCLLARVSGATVAGLELQPGLAALAQQNAEANGFADRLTVAQGDVARPPSGFAAGRFDHVMLNPPYLDPGAVRAPALELRRLATVEGEPPLETWLTQALALLCPRGCLTVIHRADRLDRLLAALAGRCGDLVVFPLWPRPGEAAKRVLVQGRKGTGAPLRLLPGLALHEAGGAYTAAAEAVLRDAAALQL